MSAATNAIRLGVSDLEARLHEDRSTTYRRYKAGKFPEPHFLCGRRFWWLSEVEEWERQEMARGSTRKSNLKHAKPVEAPSAP